MVWVWYRFLELFEQSLMDCWITQDTIREVAQSSASGLEASRQYVASIYREAFRCFLAQRHRGAMRNFPKHSLLVLLGHLFRILSQQLPRPAGRLILHVEDLQSLRISLSKHSPRQQAHHV